MKSEKPSKPQVHEAAYNPNPTQQAFHADVDSRFKLFVGSLGSGKTHAGCWEVIFWGGSKEHPGGTWIISRKTYRELTDSTQKRFLEIARDNHLLKQYVKSEERAVLRGEAGEWEVLFRSLDDPAKFESVELAGFLVDQAEEITADDFDGLARRMRQVNQPHRGIVVANHTLKSHWIYQRFIAQKLPEYAWWENATLENAANLPADYLVSLERMKEVNPAVYKRLVAGQWGINYVGRVFYPEFERDQHVNTGLTYISDQTVRRGWDFGYNHPAVVIGQRNALVDAMNILAEYIGKEETLEHVIANVKVLCNDLFPPDTMYLDYCDPAGFQKSDKGMTSVQILQKAGIHPRGFKQRVLQGTQIIRTMLTARRGGRPQLQFHPRCVTLIDGCEGGYQYADVTLGQDDKQEPKKDGFYDNSQDALRYMITGTCGLDTIMEAARQQKYPKFNPITGYF